VLVLLLIGVLAAQRLFGPADAPVESHFAEGPVEVARVVDGDTLLLRSGSRVRLIGIDTPEIEHEDRPGEPLGTEASQFTAQLVGQGPVRLEFDRERRDQYHRLLAYVHLPDGRLLNEEIVRAGYSRAEVHYAFRTDRKRQFVAAEEAAKAERRGIWAARDSDDAPANQP
jgi:micrococcal nuclease